MGLQAEAPAVRRNHQQFSACRVHSPQRRPRPFHQRHVRVSCLEIWNGLGVSAHSAAGLSGCAPCRLRCHGHSASIPHAFAPAALRAALASGGKPCGLSPPRDAWRPSMRPNRLRRIGPASAPPRWAGRWQTRWRLLRQVVRMRAVLNAGGSRHHVTKDGSRTTRPASLWSFHATPQERRRKVRRGRSRLSSGG